MGVYHTAISMWTPIHHTHMSLLDILFQNNGEQYKPMELSHTHTLCNYNSLHSSGKPFLASICVVYHFMVELLLILDILE